MSSRPRSSASSQTSSAPIAAHVELPRLWSVVLPGVFNAGRRPIAAGVFLKGVLFAILLVAHAGPTPATVSEPFPTRQWGVGLSIGYTLSATVFGGFSPVSPSNPRRISVAPIRFHKQAACPAVSRLHGSAPRHAVTCRPFRRGQTEIRHKLPRAFQAREILISAGSIASLLR